MPSPKRRADATRNRARIVEAARQHIVAGDAESEGLRLNEIAKAAGVGQGTMYRHFPTREDLLAAVYHADVDALVDAAPALLAKHPPVTALECWFRELAEYAELKRGVLAALTSQAGTDLAGPSADRISTAITVLLDAGKATGEIRDDADAADVILLVGALTRIRKEEWDIRAPSLLRIISDGLRSIR